MARGRLLSALEVERIKEPGTYTVSENLLMRVGSGKNSRSWIAKIAYRGKRIELGLGSCRHVTLKSAREKVALIRNGIENGLDPYEALNPVQTPSFEQLARRLYSEHATTLKNGKHRDQWLSSLEHYAFPKLGDIPIDQLSTRAVIDALLPIWNTKEETARRVLQRIIKVSEYAVGHNFREHELSKNGIRQALPRQTRTVRHHAACPVDQASELYRDIESEASGMSAFALRLIMLTGVRSGEARGATWEEFDFENALWTIPANRMKASREHRVPLSREAIAVLASVPKLANERNLVFPNSKGNPLSDVAVSKVLKRFAPGFTVHGLRSTFRDWSAVETDYPDDVAEAALAHVDTNRVRAAYKRTDLLEKRRLLMEDWSQFLSSAE